MERPRRQNVALHCHLWKEENAIFRKCSGTNIMGVTQHKNIFSALSTCVIQTVNGFGQQGAGLCELLAFQDISGQMICTIPQVNTEQKLTKKKY